MSKMFTSVADAKKWFANSGWFEYEPAAPFDHDALAGSLFRNAHDEFEANHIVAEFMDCDESNRETLRNDGVVGV